MSHVNHPLTPMEPVRALPANLAQRDGDVVLRDGSTVRVRVMRPEDEELLFELFKSLSADSRWLRFLSATSD